MKEASILETNFLRSSDRDFSRVFYWIQLTTSHVGLAIERDRPDVRRLQEEHDREKREARRTDVAVHRGVGDQRGRGGHLRS